MSMFLLPADAQCKRASIYSSERARRVRDPIRNILDFQQRLLYTKHFSNCFFFFLCFYTRNFISIFFSLSFSLHYTECLSGCRGWIQFLREFLHSISQHRSPQKKCSCIITTHEMDLHQVEIQKRQQITFPSSVTGTIETAVLFLTGRDVEIFQQFQLLFSTCRQRNKKKKI